MLSLATFYPYRVFGKNRSSNNILAVLLAVFLQNKNQKILILLGLCGLIWWTVSPPFLSFSVPSKTQSNYKSNAYAFLIAEGLAPLFKLLRFYAVTFTVTSKNAVTAGSYCKWLKKPFADRRTTSFGFRVSAR